MPETNCKIASALVTLALRKKILFIFCAIRVVFSDPITYCEAKEEQKWGVAVDQSVKMPQTVKTLDYFNSHTSEFTRCTCT